MVFFPIFLSVVMVVRNQSANIEEILLEASSISSFVSDYELIVIDNSSVDDSVLKLKVLSREDGLPNMQVYALTKQVDNDTASWVGLENALGDFIVVIDPLSDDINFLPHMLDKAAAGLDVVFASNKRQIKQGFLYRSASAIFNKFYKYLNGIHLVKDAPHYRILSKRVVNFILQHPQPVISYRHLPATGGFSRINLTYDSVPRVQQMKSFKESIDKGVSLLVSTTHIPMRLVTSLSLFGAIANVLYSIYVLAIGIFKANVAPGWISLSLQQSGMFFLISLVLLVLGEYILHMASLTNEGPLYHVGQEFTSVRLTRKEKLNIEEVMVEFAEST